MNTFVKTTTITTKNVCTVRNGVGPEQILMSVRPLGKGSIDLVIGASATNSCASSLSKKGLAKLIEILQDIHEAIEE